jgi:hypothetical protein
MGALVAQDLTDAERTDRAVTAFTRSGPVFSPTLPMIALSSGRRVDRLLAKFLGSTLIEDLPLNCFCASDCSISKPELHSSRALTGTH